MRIEFSKDNIFEETLLELRKLIQGTKWEGHVWLVGGGVRDKLLGKELHDIDLVVNYPNGGIDFAEWVCKETDCYKKDSNPVIFPVYQTAKFNIRSIHNLSKVDIECVHTRREQYHTKESRNPSVEYGTITQDANRRDLTINALYCNITTGIIADPTTRGLDDLKNHIIQTPTDPNTTFNDDPLRILRVIRFATKLGWGIERKTWLGIIENVHRISIISQERITEELTKILTCDNPSKGINRLRYCGLLGLVLPDIKNLIGVEQGQQHVGDVYEHTMLTIDNSVCDKNTRWSCLFHDIGKLETFTKYNKAIHFFGHERNGALSAISILKKMRFSNSDIKEIVSGIKYHMTFKDFGNKAPSKKTIRRFLSKVNDEHLNLVLNVIDADNKSHSKPFCLPNQVEDIRKSIEVIREEANGANKVTLPLNGKDIMSYFKLKSGPTIGRLMNAVNDMVIESPSITKEECLEKLKVILAV